MVFSVVNQPENADPAVPAPGDINLVTAVHGNRLRVDQIARHVPALTEFHKELSVPVIYADDAFNLSATR
jgi:hypothetical protein